MSEHVNNYSDSAILKAIGLLNSAKRDVIDVAEIADPEIVKLASETTPRQLDASDLFILLAGEVKNSPDTISESEAALRKKLLLPERDPDGIKLGFEFERVGGHILASVRITPTDASETKPDVFIGGLFHTAGMYLLGAVEYAKAEKRPLVLIDSLGNGSSCIDKDSTINYEMLTKDIAKAIRAASSDDGIRYLMGHSLGSIVVRDLYFAFKSGAEAQLAEKYIPVTMVPAGNERLAAFKMNRLFSLEQTPHIIFQEKMAPTFADYFFNLHPEHEKKWLNEFVERQRMSTDLFGFIEVINSIADRSLLEFIGSDDLVVVFADEDKLMERHGDHSAWERRGVITLKNADHSALAGGSYAVENWLELSRSLSQTNELKQPIDIDELARHGTLSFGLVLKGGFELAAPDYKSDFKSSLGLSAEAGFGLMLGIELLAVSGVYLDLEEASKSTANIGGGLKMFPDTSSNFSLSFLLDAGTSINLPAEQLSAGARIELSYNMFDICRLFGWFGSSMQFENSLFTFSGGAGIRL